VDVRWNATVGRRCTVGSALLDINGDINLNANTLTVRANTGDFFFSGLIRRERAHW